MNGCVCTLIVKNCEIMKFEKRPKKLQAKPSPKSAGIQVNRSTASALPAPNNLAFLSSLAPSTTNWHIMSLDPPTYLSSLQNNIRARPIPWEGAVRAGTITDNDLKTIKAVDKVRKEQRKQTVENDIESYQSLILGGDKGKSVLDSASKRSDVIQYMLVLTGDLINGIASRPIQTVLCLGVLTVDF